MFSDVNQQVEAEPYFITILTIFYFLLLFVTKS